jgi:hypothetical protein
MVRETINGWRLIASHLGISERHAKRLGLRDDDPMPVRKRLGRVYVYCDDLGIWMQRQDQPYHDRARSA